MAGVPEHGSNGHYKTFNQSYCKTWRRPQTGYADSANVVTHGQGNLNVCMRVQMSVGVDQCVGRWVWMNVGVMTHVSPSL